MSKYICNYTGVEPRCLPENMDTNPLLKKYNNDNCDDICVRTDAPQYKCDYSKISGYEDERVDKQCRFIPSYGEMTERVDKKDMTFIDCMNNCDTVSKKIDVVTKKIDWRVYAYKYDKQQYDVMLRYNYLVDILQNKYGNKVIKFEYCPFFDYDLTVDKLFTTEIGWRFKGARESKQIEEIPNKYIPKLISYKIVKHIQNVEATFGKPQFQTVFLPVLIDQIGHAGSSIFVLEYNIKDKKIVIRPFLFDPSGLLGFPRLPSQDKNSTIYTAFSKLCDLVMDAFGSKEVLEINNEYHFEMKPIEYNSIYYQLLDIGGHCSILSLMFIYNFTRLFNEYFLNQSDKVIEQIDTLFEYHLPYKFKCKSFLRALTVLQKPDLARVTENIDKSISIITASIKKYIQKYVSKILQINYFVDTDEYNMIMYIIKIITGKREKKLIDKFIDNYPLVNKIISEASSTYRKILPKLSVGEMIYNSTSSNLPIDRCILDILGPDITKEGFNLILNIQDTINDHRLHNVKLIEDTYMIYDTAQNWYLENEKQRALDRAELEESVNQRYNLLEGLSSIDDPTDSYVLSTKLNSLVLPDKIQININSWRKEKLDQKQMETEFEKLEEIGVHNGLESEEVARFKYLSNYLRDQDKVKIMKEDMYMWWFLSPGFQALDDKIDQAIDEENRLRDKLKIQYKRVASEAAKQVRRKLCGELLRREISVNKIKGYGDVVTDACCQSYKARRLDSDIVKELCD